MKSPEDYFKMGADAMKSEIAVRFALKGQFDTSKFVLCMPYPAFKEKEEMVMEVTNVKPK